MTNFAIIPIRKKSKRLKNKNFLKFNKKMLFEHTLDAAIKSKCFDKIIISSDYKFSKITTNKYKNIIFDKRPDSLCNDNSKALEVIKYYFKKFSMQNDNGTVSLLLVTCPLRESKDIKKAFSILNKSKKTDGIISVTDYGFPYKMSLKMNHKILEPYWKNSPLINGNTRSQDHKPVFRPNGGFYIKKIDKFKKHLNFFKGRIKGYYMPLERSIDVDNKIQFKIAEFIQKKKL